MEKLLAPEISLGGNFSFDKDGEFYSTTKVYGYIKKNEIKESYLFWMALLNSQLFWFFIKQTGYVLRGGYFTFKTNYIVPFPVPNSFDPIFVNQIEKLVSQILILKTKKNEPETRVLEKEIDQLIYQIFSFTENEIEEIENSDF